MNHTYRCDEFSMTTETVFSKTNKGGMYVMMKVMRDGKKKPVMGYTVLTAKDIEALKVELKREFK